MADSLPNGRLARADDFRPVEADLSPSRIDLRRAGFNIELSPVFKTPEEIRQGSLLPLDLPSDARYLHDRDHFLADELTRLRARLDALGARRIWRGNAWFWDLKPDLKPGEVKVLAVIQAEAAYSDVVMEAQETVELACKAVLRQLGIEPPHWHDVGELLREYRARLASIEDAELERVVTASAWLRKEREFSFYGDIDFIPRERYGRDEAMRAVEDARFVVGIAARVIPDVDPISPSGGAAAPS